eukprot:TRINITY_DN11543_c0_g1_i1.p1 TRINITY_DN11543_c0_g1~~TRINITY_DN11543_c0_g1_i1.p1  ORF type:complete len:265 (-),score=28.06 TRINITY_DN11543_c0_g1_i1:58-801(-)
MVRAASAGPRTTSLVHSADANVNETSDILQQDSSRLRSDSDIVLCSSESRPVSDWVLGWDATHFAAAKESERIGETSEHVAESFLSRHALADMPLVRPRAKSEAVAEMNKQRGITASSQNPQIASNSNCVSTLRRLDLLCVAPVDKGHTDSADKATRLRERRLQRQHREKRLSGARLAALARRCGGPQQPETTQAAGPDTLNLGGSSGDQRRAGAMAQGVCRDIACVRPRLRLNCSGKRRCDAPKSQ